MNEIIPNSPCELKFTSLKGSIQTKRTYKYFLSFLNGNLTTQFISSWQVAICKIGGFSDPQKIHHNDKRCLESGKSCLHLVSFDLFYNLHSIVLRKSNYCDHSICRQIKVLHFPALFIFTKWHFSITFMGLETNKQLMEWNF